MAWFNRKQPSLTPDEGEKKVKTEGLWLKCDGCSQVIWRKGLEDNHWICDKCGFHFKMDAAARLRHLFDDGVYEEFDANLVSTDPLAFSDSRPYSQRLSQMRASTGVRDAVLCGVGKLNGRRVHICSMELKFIGGSMGAVVGEKITRAIERCLAERAPIIIVCASGGARM
jgi:acetyl-CoA carboxylase carboxyl transferase subunit beta